MRNLYLIAKEDFINLIKNPMWVFYATLFPVVLIFIMGYLSEKSFGNGVTSYDYYGVTMIIYGLLNSGMTSANAFMEIQIRKPNMRIIYAPGHVRDIYLSKIVASFAFSYLFHMIDFAIVVLVLNVHVSHVGMLLLLFALTELFAVTLGIMLCCIFKTEAVTNQIQSILVNILAILGGLLFSLDGFGKAARTLSLCSPVKWVMDGCFQLIYDNKYGTFGIGCAFLIIATIIMLFVCKIKFKKEDCIC